MNSSSRKVRLNDAVTRGLASTERSRVEESFKASPTFLRTLADKLEKTLDTKIKDAESFSQYLNPNWAQVQADNRGYRRAVRDILNLFIEYK